MSERPESQSTQLIPPPRMEAAGGEPLLVVIRGSALGEAVVLNDVPVIIGRAGSADVQLDHTSVSRQHAAVWHEGGRAFVRDLGSSNGVFVNEKKVAETELTDGDRVTIGEITFKLIRRDSVEGKYHETLYRLASVDSLTGLLNRRRFKDVLDEAVPRATAAAPLSLVMMDLDHFKQVNDKYGHPAGDDVIRAASAALRAQLGPGQFGGRLGGEEFAALLPGKNAKEAIDWAEQLRSAISGLTIETGGHSLKVTSSMGVAQWVPALGNTGVLLKAADLALYRAKQEGRNRVCLTQTT